MQVVQINSRTSTLWKLNTENGKIVSFSKNGQVILRDHSIQPKFLNSCVQCTVFLQLSNALFDNDPIFEIITSTVACTSNGNLVWSKQHALPNNITLELVFMSQMILANE